MLTRVLLVEDDAEVRQRLARAVTHDASLSVIAAVGTCAEARAVLARERTEVLLVDLGLPDGRGSDLIREALAQHADVLAMVITVFGDEAHVVEAIEAGAVSYLLKDASHAQVPRAIAQMLSGGSPISPGVARHLLKRVCGPALSEAVANKTSQTDGDEPIRFSARETDVLDLVAKGYSYVEIGEALGISVNTVGTYVKQIYRKLSVKSRGEAVYEAQRKGLMDRVPSGSRSP